MTEDERITEIIAKRLYDYHVSNDPVIHCNRFPTWDELSEDEREYWRNLE